MRTFAPDIMFVGDHKPRREKFTDITRFLSTATCEATWKDTTSKLNELNRVLLLFPRNLNAIFNRCVL